MDNRGNNTCSLYLARIPSVSIDTSLVSCGQTTFLPMALIDKRPLTCMLSPHTIMHVFKFFCQLAIQLIYACQYVTFLFAAYSYVSQCFDKTGMHKAARYQGNINQI